MKRHFVLTATIVALAFGAPWMAAVAAQPEASREWALIQQDIAAMSEKTASGDAYADFVKEAGRRDRLHGRLRAFLARYQSDERSREAMFHLLMRPPVFLIAVDPDRFRENGPAGARYDEDALRRWEQEAAALHARFLDDPAIRSEWRRDLLRRDLYMENRDALARIQRGEHVDLAALRAKLDDWMTQFPQSDRAAVPVESYMRVLAAGDPEAVEREWEQFAQSDNPVVQELAQGQLLIHRSKKQPLDWKFMALDGRTVDFTALRGKVVLIDFWATWCVPCVEEMPELTDLYARYREKGFEIIGVSLDSAADRGKLERFVASRRIGWPQHFDGKGRRNTYAVQYGIKSIPTKILLDREGRVVNPRLQIKELAPVLERYFGN